MELKNVWSLALLVLQHSGLNNLDGSSAESVASCQVLVHLVDSSVHGDVSVLLEHVVVSSSRQDSEPNTVVLDNGRVLLEDLVDGNDLSVRLLNSFQALDEIPKLRSSANLIGCPHLHAKQGRLRVALRRQVAPNDLILMILITKKTR